MSKEFNVVIEKDADGFYIATVPALKGCHTQAKSLDELMQRVQEAISLCLEFEGEMDEPLEFVGIQKVAVQI
ncbi:MAG: type II toxin-antitoxin system HicB family antitoxin [Cyanobacteria bacterium J06623_5]